MFFRVCLNYWFLIISGKMRGNPTFLFQSQKPLYAFRGQPQTGKHYFCVTEKASSRLILDFFTHKCLIGWDPVSNIIVKG